MQDTVLKYLKDNISATPKTAVVLGSGLGDFVNSRDIEIKSVMPYGEIPDFPVSTVEGHSGRLIYAYYKQAPLLIMQGRVHHYEGYSMKQVTFPIRLMKLIGVENIILTNAAGAVNKDFKVGDIMAITDHISCFVPNPLIGRNDDRFGVRFPDMSAVYSRGITDVAAEKHGLKKGVYCQLTGPSYETPAEIKMLRTLGADAVGMSTVVEAIVAKHCGMNVVGYSMISNVACDIAIQKVSHEQVQAAAMEHKDKFIEVVSDTLDRLTESAEL